MRYVMLLAAIACQLFTVVITWPLWESRADPINLPVLAALPQLSFAWPMVVSLVLAAVRPRIGVPVHWLVLMTACIFDQFRLEPQFFGLAILMLAYFGDRGQRLCRWYLVSMWIWTGVHKFLSPNWIGFQSWTLVTQAGLQPEQLYLPFAIVVAASEVGLGVLAWLRPHWAARLCVAVHLGIVVFLSPILAGINYSVIPWNLAIAGVGYLILRQGATGKSQSRATVTRWEQATIAILFIIPAGFYFGWVDRCFCHVMYSGNVPRGLITTADGLEEMTGWGRLAVPFPHERRLFRQYFASTAKPGDKLHVSDPRPLLEDLYFVMRASGPEQIDADQFFRWRQDEVAGFGLDRKQSLFALSRAGVKMLSASAEEPLVYAVAFTPENFDRKLLPYLEGLPNLQQIQFADTAIEDNDLRQLISLRLLTGLGLNNTKITDAGLSQLDELPYLQYVETEGTAITNQAGK